MVHFNSLHCGYWTAEHTWQEPKPSTNPLPTLSPSLSVTSHLVSVFFCSLFTAEYVPSPKEPGETCRISYFGVCFCDRLAKLLHEAIQGAPRGSHAARWMNRCNSPVRSSHDVRYEQQVRDCVNQPFGREESPHQPRTVLPTHTYHRT